jgi:lysophospholipase L1-like esterase
MSHHSFIQSSRAHSEDPISVPAPGRKFLFGGVSAFFGVTFALLLAEFALRLISPAPAGYRAMNPNLQVTFNAGLNAKGVQGPALFKVNSMGFRSREWAADRTSEYRILCLGGSTTESILNDQSRIWTTLLEQRLGQLPDGRSVWVGNMGKAGLASKHHIAQLKHLQLYDPDLIVVLVGSSDFMSRLKQDGVDSSSILAYQPAGEEILEEQSFAVLPSRSLWNEPDSWYKSTRLWKLLYPIKSAFLDRSQRQDQDGSSLKRWREMRAAGRRSDVLPQMEVSLDAYGQNLKEMALLARDSGLPILLLTQPSIWRADLTDKEKGQLWMGGVGEFRDKPGSLYYEPAVLERGMNAFNQRVLQVCHETNAHCVDLAKAVPKSTDYFYDDEHFTDQGQKRVADAVAEGVLPLLPVYHP